MKEEILQLIKDKPKHFAQIVKRDKRLYQWVKDNSSEKCATISEQIHQSLTGERPVCKRGNQKKFKSIKEGYGFCGRANKCECARESVSAKVSKAKLKYTKEENAAINKKRDKTNLEKYGIANAGQTNEAKEKHKECYADKGRVDLANKRNKETKLKNHGNENYNNRNKAKETCQEIYNTDNPMQDSSVNQKAVQTRKENFNPFVNIKKGYERVKSRIASDFNLELLLDKADYVGVRERPIWDFKCITCGYEFCHRYDHANYPRCKVCNPSSVSYKSSAELQILEFIKAHYTGKIISGDRSLIPPYEIDIYLPDEKIAIEYCGLYWHSELSSGKHYKYHEYKYKELKNKGIQLLTIFSDEFENKKIVVFETLKTKLGVNNSDVVYARKTTIKQILKEEAISFLDRHHIQGGSVSSSINYGLFYEDTLVAVNSFKNKGNGDYELTRFACKGRVVGGASKTLTHFIKDHSPEQIKTFADNRWSNGNLYDTLGFDMDGVVPPMQQYVEDYTTRYHKLTFAKQKLIKQGHNANKTEWEIMQEMGYDRIWDCGKVRYVMSLRN